MIFSTRQSVIVLQKPVSAAFTEISESDLGENRYET